MSGFRGITGWRPAPAAPAENPPCASCGSRRVYDCMTCDRALCFDCDVPVPTSEDTTWLSCARTCRVCLEALGRLAR